MHTGGGLSQQERANLFLLLSTLGRCHPRREYKVNAHLCPGSNVDREVNDEAENREFLNMHGILDD
ncbi:MAG TPA: hypothetical protein DCE44_08595 [Verrucomicrobiales bacterium]|nr:hypothetical protein [Verrucomicrobiales bacterium]